MRVGIILLLALSSLVWAVSAVAESPYIYGTHFWREGENLDCFNGKVGWITELKTAANYASPDLTEWKRIVDEGHTIILRVNFDGSNTWAPSPSQIDWYASYYAHWVERVKDYCHIYIIGNEDGVLYDQVMAVRNAIHAVQPDAILCPGAPQDHVQPQRDLGDYIDGYVIHGVGTGWIDDADAAWPSAITKPVYVTETAADPPHPSNKLREQLAEINDWNSTHDHKVQAVCKFVYYENGVEFSSQQMEPMQTDDFREATATTNYLNSYAQPYIGVTDVVITPASETSSTLSYNTNATSTAQIEYWREGERTQSWSSFQSSYTTTHSITLTGLIPGATYQYLIKSWSPTRPLSFDAVRSFTQVGPSTGTISGAVRDRSGKALDEAKVVRNPGGYVYYTDSSGNYAIQGVPAGKYSIEFSDSEAAQVTIDGVTVKAGQTKTLDVSLAQRTNYLANSDLEGGTTGWTAYGSGFEHRVGTWNLGTITPHGGTGFVGRATNSAGNSGGLYQRVAVPNGEGYAARAFSCIYRGDCPYIEVKSRIGIDPTGGTSATSPNVQWSSYDYDYTQWIWNWNELVTPTVTVSGGYATVFLDYAQLVSPGWHINCFDDAGLYSNAFVTQSAASIPDVKASEDGTGVNISGQRATTNTSDFGDRIYIENPERSSGIAVYLAGSPSVAEGNAVTVSGVVATVNGEKAITQATVTPSVGGVLQPLALINKAAGGGDSGYDAGPPSEGQKGVLNGVGLNNVGLLVKVFGKVQSHGTGYVMITDGSGAALKVDTTKLSSQPADGTFAIVTGVVSVELSGSDLIPVIRARRPTDLQ